jgi:hypothetical protein
MHDLHPVTDPLVAFSTPINSAIGLGGDAGW